jgi:hypothetical protein
VERSTTTAATDESTLVAKILIWRGIEREPLDTIARRLNEECVPAPASARSGRWNGKSVKRVIGGAEESSAKEKALSVRVGRGRRPATRQPMHVVCEARRLRALGASYEQIARNLEALGVPTARSGRWHRSTVFYLLRAAA